MRGERTHQQAYPAIYKVPDPIPGFPGDASGKELAGDVRDTGSIPGSGRSPGALEECMATHSSSLPVESHGQRSLAGYSSWVCKELALF